VGKLPLELKSFKGFALEMFTFDDIFLVYGGQFKDELSS
jgi:hypothetical protein